MESVSESTLAHALRRYLAGHREQMLAALEALVRAESPTDVPEAQGEVQDMLTRLLRTLGFQVRYLPAAEEDRGHLYACPVERPRGRPVQLLVGHCDTVWARGTLQDMPFEVDGNEVRGPGVFDMKGGLVQMLFALAALRAASVEPEVVPVVFINSDEEQGSPTSQRHLRRLARCAHRAFVLEPALGLDGKIKTARKGAGRFTVRIQGTSAHAGLDPEGGSSAILELSHMVQDLHALNDPEAGVSVNVGTIGGGTHPNVVADAGSAEVDVRVATREQADEVEAAIRGLEPTTPGTSLTIEGGVGRPPMEPTPDARRLWRRARRAAALLDLDLEEGRSGGVSDGNIISQYTPTLDGLGAVGDGAHARHEFCYVDRMVERSALLALLLAQPPLPPRPDDAAPTAETADTSSSTQTP
ncbi:M20 family metallopeptidase [Salinibacter grassmerensis]|uniref:M20 family metallopeptidase n=1 Tax=Salinibacter grassmerensis TaxID=3040353 RepID=UPI0021E7CEDA|nr:M20 family metallopeptidase [Salinibacter grassmerensis]